MAAFDGVATRQSITLAPQGENVENVVVREEKEEAQVRGQKRYSEETLSKYLNGRY